MRKGNLSLLAAFCFIALFFAACDDSGGGSSKGSGTTNKFFCANDGSTGYELWVTDGTTEGTKLV